LNKAESEFQDRVGKLKALMKERDIDVCFIYGDEYRKENLRYMSNYWPIFERGAAVVPIIGEPIVLAAPEGEQVCRERCAWPDIRLVPDFACVTVPDEIEYPYASYTDFKAVFRDIAKRQPLRRCGIVGIDAMSHDVFRSVCNALDGVIIVDANELLFTLRTKKSQNEIASIKRAAQIADEGYRALMAAAAVGRTELEVSAAAYAAAIGSGAEHIPFCLVASGARVNTIIGRPSDKRIEDGDMVMAALAVQYGGYVATVGFPFVVGSRSEGQSALIDTLIEANERAIAHMKAGAQQSELVRAVKQYFREQGVARYDLYPPLHGCGAAEAEMPYPNERSTGIFAAGMTVNTDVSLFGHPDGSNRIEEGFVITEQGSEPMSKLVRRLSAEWKAMRQASRQ
jgi:Xaa-Pro aminopeptidase